MANWAYLRQPGSGPGGHPLGCRRAKPAGGRSETLTNIDTITPAGGRPTGGCYTTDSSDCRGRVRQCGHADKSSPPRAARSPAKLRVGDQGYPPCQGTSRNRKRPSPRCRTRCSQRRTPSAHRPQGCLARARPSWSRRADHQGAVQHLLRLRL